METESSLVRKVAFAWPKSSHGPVKNMHQRSKLEMRGIDLIFRGLVLGLERWRCTKQLLESFVVFGDLLKKGRTLFFPPGKFDAVFKIAGSFSILQTLPQTKKFRCRFFRIRL